MGKLWPNLWLAATIFRLATTSPVVIIDEKGEKNGGESQIIAPSVDESYLFRICALAPHLGHTGQGRLINDCTTLDRFGDVPPCNIYGFGGNTIQVCCPDPKPILFPGDYGTPEYVAPDTVYDEEYVEYYTDEESLCQINFDYTEESSDHVVSDVPFQSPSQRCDNINGTSCSLRDQCSFQDFNKTEPPIPCGYDESTGEDKFCCSGPPSEVPIPVPAKQYGDYPCHDFVSQCKRFATNSPDSCFPGDPGYFFMRYACMESCGRCGNKGCRDEFENCPQWSRAGVCSIFPEFMIFNCRESCGTCGQRSAYNKEAQVVGGKDFTNMKSANFFCGEGKLRENIVEEGVKLHRNISNSLRPYTYQETLEKNANAFCTSTLISDRFAVTAAHCEAEFTGGRSNTQTTIIRDNTPFKEIIENRRAFVHPLYAYPSLYYDIAVVELERKVVYDYDKYGDSPACLSIGRNIDGQIANAQGFGYTENGTLADVLLQTNVTVMKNEDCAEWLAFNATERLNFRSSLKLSLNEGINNQLLCTQGIYKEDLKVYSGPCEGDSGGPLFINFGKSEENLRQQTLVGIHSGGLSCGTMNTPSWFTRVSSFQDWIHCIVDEASKSLTKAEIERICNNHIIRFDTINEIFP